MPMIGASISDLVDASSQFTGHIDIAVTTGTKVLFKVNSAITNLNTETTNAQNTCLDAVDGMKTDFGKVKLGFAAAEYVGKNADVAWRATEDMDQRCTQAVADMTAAFEQFRSQITVLGEDLAEIAKSFDNYATNAGESSRSMARALDNQRQNLEDAMSGMTY